MNQIYKSLKQYEEGRDKNPAQIAGSLIEIGEKYQSAWLKERGKRDWEGKWDSQDYPYFSIFYPYFCQSASYLEIKIN